MGLGYSVFTSNLNINGNITVKERSLRLYDVLKYEAMSNGVAREYTGEHNDSATKEGNKKIYHWYAENNEQSIDVQNKNNIIFAEHCWEILRTTDK